MKGSIAGAVLDCERAIDQIAAVVVIFDDQHPDLAEGLSIAAALLVQTQSVLEGFYLACWDTLPGNWAATHRRKGGGDGREIEGEL
jgi:hypothetical protein